MKVYRLIFVGLLTLNSFLLFAQNPTQELDTIYMLCRKKLVVQIKNVSSATVR